METSTLVPVDLDWVNFNLAVGADLHPTESVARQQIAWLQSQGITAIIDCRVEYSDEELVRSVAPEIAYLNLPVNDAHGYRMPDWAFEKATAFASKEMGRGGKVYVHCHMGVNRGPTIAMAVYMTEFGATPVQAYDDIRAARSIANIAFAYDAASWMVRKLHVNGVEDGVHYEWLANLEMRIAEVRTPQEIDRINREIMRRHAQYDAIVRGDIIHAKRSN